MPICVKSPRKPSWPHKLNQTPIKAATSIEKGQKKIVELSTKSNMYMDLMVGNSINVNMSERFNRNEKQSAYFVDKFSNDLIDH